MVPFIVARGHISRCAFISCQMLSVSKIEPLVCTIFIFNGPVSKLRRTVTLVEFFVMR